MPRYDAVLFDLLTALIDSWSLFNAVAGGPERGLAWRRAYLRRTYAAGAYVPFAQLVRDSAQYVALGLAMQEMGTTPHRTLFVAGSPGDVEGASRAGMDVYWHNRRGLPIAPGSRLPLAEERSLRPLVRFVQA
jgi:hypothetical protein